MLYFSCDYAEGCHPKVLEALTNTNMISTPGYGEDCFCKEAKQKIKDYINCPDADIYFLVGGTQTNQVVIDSMLSNYDGVIAPDTGHIAAHEGGAIEYSGHKVITLPTHDGKLHGNELKNYLETFYADENCEHMVNPGMVYISYPTEYGTLYTKKELNELSCICQRFHIPLFIDGARLSYGLAAQNELVMADIATYADVFYIGGTKAGALFGEAVVFTRKNTPKHMITQIKQHGALLAKGRLLGVQFDTLFTDDLYLSMGKHAIQMANIIREDLQKKGYKFYIETPTNQIFIVMENQKLDELKDSLSYGFWEKYDETHTVIRIATSWATTMESVEELKQIL